MLEQIVDLKCLKFRRCGEEGHMVRECSQEEATRQITDEDGTVSTLDKIT